MAKMVRILAVVCVSLVLTPITASAQILADVRHEERASEALRESELRETAPLQPGRSAVAPQHPVALSLKGRSLRTRLDGAELRRVVNDLREQGSEQPFVEVEVDKSVVRGRLVDLRTYSMFITDPATGTTTQVAYRQVQRLNFFTPGRTLTIVIIAVTVAVLVFVVTHPSQ